MTKIINTLKYASIVGVSMWLGYKWGVDETMNAIAWVETVVSEATEKIKNDG